MDIEVIDLKNEYPDKKQCFLSRVLFIWTIPIISRALRNPLKMVDLFKLSHEDKSMVLSKELEQNWKWELKSAIINEKKPKLQKVLWDIYFKRAMPHYICGFVNVIFLRIVVCILLQKFTGLFIANDPNEKLAKWIVGNVLVICTFISCVIHHYCHHELSCLGTNMIVATTSLIYTKALKMSLNSLDKISAGKIINIISNDIHRFSEVTIALQYLITGPLQLVVLALSMWQFIGLSSLSGTVFLGFFIIPLQIFMGNMSSKFRRRVAGNTDNRVKLMHEIISGIKVIKMYAWEKPFGKLIAMTRMEELRGVYDYLYYQMPYYSKIIQSTSSYLSIITIFFTTRTLSADVVFSCSQYLSALKPSFLVWFPRGLSTIMVSRIATDRADELLLSEEVPNLKQITDNVGKITLSKVEASYSGDSKFMLRLDGIEISSGCLCAIVGPVGSGKSTLLHLVLRELTPITGMVHIGGTVSYSSQEAWLFTSSVRQNILFGQEYQDHKYKRVVNACSLQVDFNQFPKGDMNSVGERGLILSGGQKARLNLARAIYRDADIYLLDDPLSAVDIEVGRQIFENCLLTYLKGKTRLIVTHHLQYLERADLIIFIDKGEAKAYRSLEELKEMNSDIKRLLNVANIQTEVEQKSPSSQKKNSINEKMDTKDNGPSEEETPSNKGALMEYLKSGGNIFKCLSIIFLFLFLHSLTGFTDFWLAIWCKQEYSRGEKDEPITSSIGQAVNETVPPDGISEDSKWGVIIYSCLILIVTAMTLLSSSVLLRFLMTASRKLHDKMFYTLLKVPLAFFDTYSSGRIMNRFSSDMGSVDESFPDSVQFVVQVYLSLIVTMITIFLSNMYMLPVIIITFFVYSSLQKWFITIGKQTKQLVAVARSPVFSMFIHTLRGVTTIRANGVGDILEKQFYKLLDTYSSALQLCVTATSAFALWVDLSGAFVIAFTVNCFILFDHQFGGVNASYVGLGMFQSMSLSGALQYGMRRSIDMVHSIVSIERVMEYSKLDTEESREDIEDIPQWPEKGAIEYKNISMRYLETQVLRDLNFQINAREKIGIVGRTGAGKTSLLMALFNLYKFDGSILIDGVDTKTVKLENLRRNISIIPQEPVLFSETIRYNLDPFGEYTDDQIWAALDQSLLRSAVPSLNMMVTEGGTNFSTGQKQLTCLARAILRNNKIVVLDEATANVDHKTDELIQTTIKNKFSECTIITIAHRLNTIMESDKVLVMDAGVMVEYDHPHKLIEKRGTFFNLLMETGDAVSKHLRDIAREHYENCYNERIHCR
ncbi:hypothetical protein JTB14_021044 [Gonioctena quinquepunctata]|nr:hypothetical protein JTB14_021044 [Gonioctena quinquepunctata]